jgi:type II secretory pathway component GspD/PulD (secretin)
VNEFPPLFWVVAIWTVLGFGLSRSRAQGPTDLARLVHPEVAERLGLSDKQRGEIQTLLQQLTEARLNPDAAAAAAKGKEIESKIEQALTPEQLQQWKTTPPSGDLEFRFRDQAWGDVLQWFADQEGLTLVMDRTPPGTFTYYDNRRYSSAQAVDLLNSVLMTRGFTLIRREKLLTLMQVSNTIPIELIPEATLESLPSRGRFELVRVKFPLGTRPVEAVVSEVTGYLGPMGRAIPLPQSKQLLVVETAGKMETINVLINSVPEPAKPAAPQPPPPPPVPVFAAYPLGELDPNATLEAIKKLVNSERILVDTQTRVLHAYVVPAEQVAIQSAIEKMRGSLVERAPDKSVAYEIGDIDPEALTTQLKGIAPQAVVAIDATTKRALITASEADQARIADALKALGGTPAAEGLAMQTFPVEPGQAVTLATALQGMLPKAKFVGNDTVGNVVARGSSEELKLVEEIVRRYRGDDSLGGKSLQTFPLEKAADSAWLGLVKRVLPKAELWLDDDGKRLVLLGSDEERKRLEASLPGLMGAIETDGDERQLKLYPMNPGALALWNQLQTAVIENLPGVEVVVKPAEGGQMAQLMVWATEPQHEKVTKWVEQLRQSAPDSQGMKPRVHAIGDRDPKLIGELLTQRFPGIKAEAAEGGVMVWADAATQDQIAAWVEEVQAGLPAKAERELKSYRVGGMLPTELQTLVTPLLGADAVGNVTVDSQGGRLLVFAPPAAHQKIESLVGQLAQPLPTDQQRVLVAYSLEHADATSLQGVIAKAVSDATVVTDAAGRQLIVTATLADQGKIKAILAEVDRPVSPSAAKELKSYKLDKIQAVTLLPTLQKLVPRMELTADTTGNMILATGPSADHQTLRETLDRLQGDGGEAARTVKTFEVPAGDLRTLPAILAQLAPQAVLSTDDTNRTVIAWGTAQEHQRIEEAIKQLSQSAQDRDQVIVFSVPPDQTVAIQTAVTTLFTGVKVAADPVTGQLTMLVPKTLRQQVEDYMRQRLEKVETPEPKTYRVRPSIRTAFVTLLPTVVPKATIPISGFSRGDGGWKVSGTASSVATAQADVVVVIATPADHVQVDGLLKRLDVELGPDEPTVTKAYTLGKVDPTTFAALLAERRPTAKVIASSDPKRPLIADSEAGHEAIAGMIKELEPAFADEVAKELRVYPVREDIYPQASGGLATIVPEARPLPSSSSSRLSVLATKEDHEKLAAWLEQLQASIPAPQGKTSRVYALKDGDPTAAARLLQALLPTVVLAADVPGRTIAATANEDEHKKIQELIAQVDKPATDAKQTRVFTVGAGQARELVTAVAQMLPELRVTAETSSNSLIATGSAADLAKVEELIRGIEQSGTKATLSRTYVLKTASPVYFQIALKELFPRATVASDPISGSLLISATEEQHAQIATMIDDLNKSAKPDDELKIFKLEHGKAQQVALTLQQSFGRRSTAGISADVEANAILVIGTPEQHQLATKLIEQLDKASTQSSQTKVFQIQGGTAREMAIAISQMLPEADVTPESGSNSVIVSATPADLQRVDEMIRGVEQAGGGAEISRTYVLKTASPVYFQIALKELFPRSTVAADPVSGSLLISATEEQHAQIATMIDDLNKTARPAEELKIFPLKHGKAERAVQSLQQAVGRRTAGGITADVAANSVMVVGTPEQHAMAGKLIEQLDQPVATGNETRVFTLAAGTAREMSIAISQMLPDAEVSPETSSNSVIVTASAEDLQRVEKMVQGVAQGGGEAKVSRTYTLRSASPVYFQAGLEELFPRATVAADPVSGSLLISATEAQHVQIGKMVEELNTAAKSTDDLKVFKLQHADPEQVAEALQQSFGRRSTAGVSADVEAGALFVVGSPEQHALAAKLVEQFDQPTAGRDLRTLRAFSMAGLSGRDVSEAVTQLFEDSRPKVDVQYDMYNEQLVVIGSDQQLAQVEKIVEQFKPPVRSLEVFTLSRNEPKAVEEAITAMFLELPYSQTPSVTADEDRQQLIIRATEEHMLQIRELLERLGESTEPVQGRAAPLKSERMRTIPIGRDRDEILRKLRQAWPQVSDNPLRVIGLDDEQTPAGESPSQEEKPSASEAPPADPQSPKSPPVPVLPAPAEGTDAAIRNGREPLARGPQQPGPQRSGPFSLVAMQNAAVDPMPAPEAPPTPAPEAPPTPAPEAPPAPAPEAPPAPAPEGPSTAAPETPVAPADDAAGEAAEARPAKPPKPPIILIPSGDSWTIASEDTAAVELLSKWIEAAEKEASIDAIEVGRNGAIFVLKHANADELQTVLTTLYRRTDSNRGSGSREGDTRIVADSRINALIVRGPSTDRDAIKELLEVLDSPTFIGIFKSPPPIFVPVENADAKRIEEILRSVYAAQVSRGGGRPPITIPTGVSDEIASMLEQINATVSGPLLQLSVDEVSNAIVMRAPPELAKEVQDFIKQIDNQATTSRSQGIRVVPLNGSNADTVRDLIRSLRSGNRR